MFKAKSFFLGVLIGVLGLIAGGLAVGVVQAQSFGGAASTANRPIVTGTVQCFATTRRDNANGAATANAIRASRGLGDMRPNDKLAAAAARHACDMAQRNQMTHQGSRLRKPSHRVRAQGYRQTIVAENIGKGFDSAEQVQRAWVNSRSHLSNILLPQVEEFGIGRAVAADGRTVYWAAVYAAPR